MQDWHKYFEYRNGFLYWKDVSPRHVAGEMVGFVSDNWYMKLSLDGDVYYVHRVIWEMFNGPIPDGGIIDHINHNIWDCRIENLRLTDKSGNATNQRKRQTRFYRGVRKRGKRYIAYICVNNKQKYLGSFSTLEGAIKARQEAEIKYGFHPNHWE
ncbi:HNH endonuclease [Escherichia coli]|uniref:HNH endonuclease n=1 Tax=Escherichia coli TaxID=562 RepID=UPI0010C55250|nr:HNH endonuclease [Escherichia coli]GDJ45878.1 HNH endonuclease [Escherichia coli]